MLVSPLVALHAIQISMSESHLLYRSYPATLCRLAPMSRLPLPLQILLLLVLELFVDFGAFGGFVAVVAGLDYLLAIV